MALVPFPGSQSGRCPMPPDDDDDDRLAGKMSFLEHLDELRKRIVHSLIAIAVGVVDRASRSFSSIYDFLLAPTQAVLPAGSKTDLHAAGRSVLAATSRSSLIAGVDPRVAVHHVSGLDVHRAGPVLEREEVRDPVRAVLDARLPRRRGVQSLHRVPVHDDVLRELQHAGSAVHAEARATCSGCTRRCCSAWRLVFQMPTVVFFLAKMKMVTARFLVEQVQVRAADHLRRCRRHHADRRSGRRRSIFAAPMIGLYLLSIGIAWLVTPRGAKAAHEI